MYTYKKVNGLTEEKSDWFYLDRETKEPIRCPPGCITALFEDEPKGSKHLGDDTIGNARVSTVFLGLDHSYGDGPPLVFETMVFGGPDDDEQERYSTWAEAMAGHQRWVERQKTIAAAAFSDVPA